MVECEGAVYFLSKEVPPAVYFRATDVTGAISLPAGKDVVMPGDTMDMKVNVIQSISIEMGLGFDIREAGRAIGAGTVLKSSSNFEL